MKINLQIIYIGLIIISCNNSRHFDNLIGSWYHVNKDKGTYREIHIDDSLFVYSYDNADIVIPFNYIVKEDSVFLLENKKNVIEKYQILTTNSSKKRMFLINKNEKLLFIKMDSTIENLNDIFIDFESLDSFSFDFHQRKNNILYSLDDYSQ